MKENDKIYNRQLRVRLPDNIWGQIEIYAKATNRSVNNVIRVAVEEYLSKNTQNETLFLEAMHKMTESFKQFAVQEKETAELVSSVHDKLDSIESGLNKVEYEGRIQIVLFLDFLRHSYSLFRKEVDSKNRTQQDMEASINFMNDYLQEFVAFRNKYGNNFFKKALDAKS